MAKSLELLARLSLVVQAVAKLAAVTIPSGFADTTIDRMLLPIEVLGSESRTVSRTIDPRIMISPFGAPIFQPLPIELHRAIKDVATGGMDRQEPTIRDRQVLAGGWGRCASLYSNALVRKYQWREGMGGGTTVL